MLNNPCVQVAYSYTRGALSNPRVMELWTGRSIVWGGVSTKGYVGVTFSVTLTFVTMKDVGHGPKFLTVCEW